MVDDFHKSRNSESHQAEGHDNPEEALVANVFGDETRHHAGYHHTTEVLTCRTDREDCCGVFATREGDEVEGVGSKAKTVAYLFNADTGADEPKVVGGVITEIDINDVGQGDAEHERPQALLQAPFRHRPTTDDAAKQQTYDAQSAIDEAEIDITHAQATFSCGACKEQRHNLGQQSFRKAEQEDEADGRDEVRLGEEHLQGTSKLMQFLLKVETIVHGFHPGKDESMIQTQEEHEDAEDEENDHPRCGDRLE